METVIKELTQKLKDFKHWERLALMKGENKKADQYGKYAKEYQQAINVLCDGKADSTSEKDLRVCEVIASASFDCDDCLHFPCQKNKNFYGSVEKKMPLGNCGDHSEHGYQ